MSVHLSGNGQAGPELTGFQPRLFFCIFMDNFYFIITGYILAIISILLVYAFLNYKNRKLKKNRKIAPNHKAYFKPPTYRFQKYHPNFCSHERGIYRKVKIKILDNTIEKTIFVCADCLNVLDKNELEESDAKKHK